LGYLLNRFKGLCGILFALQQPGLSCFTGTRVGWGAGVCNFLASGVDSNKTDLYISPPVVGA